MFKAEVDHKTVEYQPWNPTTDPLELKVLGKAMEEAGEYVSALSRCLLQGIDECEPQTGKPNSRWLEEEIADVVATLQHVVENFSLDTQFMEERATIKFRRLQEWHRMN